MAHFRKTLFIFNFILLCSTVSFAGKFAELDSPDTEQGYLAYLLINENPFPGEKGYQSIEDSKKGMRQILWVINNRLNEIPEGYTQFQIANVKTKSVTNIITAKGQCEGFHMDDKGKPSFENRVQERINYLLKIANSGKGPGKFAELLNYAKTISRNYIDYLKIYKPDIFMDLFVINRIDVTGRGYSWMTNRDYYNPGGDYISIPDKYDGSISGNRFFTLKKRN
ncbi:MAG TPA: hypothetical protein DD381_07460 [Lentisphaeria bacterium]|nr:MAG: hypothetical protein A2X47_04040 [Lentisphaerae bacterium GWF2_38_69]HBM16159.1 hypothetical protein [Lentisphaeria bacterium]